MNDEHLYNHSYFEVLWAKEYAGEILTNYEIADLVNYYFLYWDFEETYTYTDEEKARLQKYIGKLRDDVEWRLGRTDGELEALYEELTAEQGLDYGKVIEYVEDGNVWVASAIKATESMDDEAWMNKMFPVLDELYEAGNDWELILIYYNTTIPVKSQFFQKENVVYIYLIQLKHHQAITQGNDLFFVLSNSIPLTASDV